VNYTLLGKKVGMSQIFENTSGEAFPITVIEIEDMMVFDKKTEEKDGYNALRVACFDAKKAKKVSKPVKGNYKNDKKKVDLPLKNVMKEFRVTKEELEKYKAGDIIGIDAIKGAKFVDVSGTTKGKGFQGVMKRWNFSGGVGSHGSMSHRAPGSIGSSTYPARVFKNMKMAGHLGNEKVTIQNLKVIEVKEKYLLVQGAIPGANNSIVAVSRAKKKKQ